MSSWLSDAKCCEGLGLLILGACERGQASATCCTPRGLPGQRRRAGDDSAAFRAAGAPDMFGSARVVRVDTCLCCWACDAARTCMSAQTSHACTWATSASPVFGLAIQPGFACQPRPLALACVPHLPLLLVGLGYCSLDLRVSQDFSRLRLFRRRLGSFCFCSVCADSLLAFALLCGSKASKQHGRGLG